MPSPTEQELKAASDRVHEAMAPYTGEWYSGCGPSDSGVVLRYYGSPAVEPVIRRLLAERAPGVAVELRHTPGPVGALGAGG